MAFIPEFQGFGIYVNSSLSRFIVESSRIESNGADGIRYAFHDAIPDQKVDGIDSFELCTAPIINNQIYPIRLYLEQHQSSGSPGACKKVL